MANNDSDSWIAVILGILGLVAVAKILEDKKCKLCGELNPKNNIICKRCGGTL